jgi:hypothetical protein
MWAAPSLNVAMWLKVLVCADFVLLTGPLRIGFSIGREKVLLFSF